MTLAIAFAGFFIFMIINLPISFGIGLGAMLASLTMDIDRATIIQRMISAVNSFPLLAVIFFIFAGTLLGRGGVSTRLVRLAEVLVGRIPGALAHVTILACMFFGGVSGSAVAEISSIGAMMIPTMEKAGYKKPTATAIALASAVMGPIIPPSIPMIIFAHTAGSVSIAALFLAGAIPGIAIGLGLMTWAFFHARKYITPAPLPKLSLKEKLYRVGDGMAGLFTIFIILGGIISGLFTATEAGAVASLYAIILCCGIYRETKFSELPKILFECCQVNAVVLFLVATSSVFTWVLTYENLPKTLANTVFAITDNKFILLIVINIFLLIVGCLVDLTPAVIMLTPILLPLMQKMGMHIVHFGAMIVINLCYGLITPPVGTSLFVGCRIAKLPIMAVVRPLAPLLLIEILVLIVVTYWPPFTMWLPHMFGFVR
ncbi:MAG TPA: TRAP transporter large permease [Candidatus Baltobacteraceae bacterium]|nr:TRAP transporter large permease [Candidatus Baltobacteraceae bacterium]